MGVYVRFKKPELKSQKHKLPVQKFNLFSECPSISTFLALKRKANQYLFSEGANTNCVGTVENISCTRFLREYTKCQFLLSFFLSKIKIRTCMLRCAETLHRLLVLHSEFSIHISPCTMHIHYSLKGTYRWFGVLCLASGTLYIKVCGVGCLWTGLGKALPMTPLVAAFGF